VEAWVALDTYPWNWVPLVDQEEYQQNGYFFGIDAFGHLGLQVAIDRKWYSLTSTATLPLKKWTYVASTFDSMHGLAIYMDGKNIGELNARGKMTPTDKADLVLGRVRRPVLPFPSEAIHPRYPVRYSLDGILDEVKIYDRSLSAEEIRISYAATNAPGGEVLPWPTLPSGPPGPGRFGAVYTTLKFQDTWDNLRRIGPDSDVVVRFDRSPMRLVFWQGTNYVPAWVTENGKWYTDEFLEAGGSPECPDGEDCEPMSDRQERYSHVRILENSEARVVVHWRYALSEVEKYKGANPDPLTGWFDWADEYWTVYPDGVAVRKQVLRSSNIVGWHEWQETIVINAPGTRPEDNINLDALTLANMKGETATYTWSPKPPGSFERPHGPGTMDKPENANIQMVNLRSTLKPFQIVSPVHSSVDAYSGEKTYFTFECWNHWPVAQIISSGRPAVAPDRPSHTSLSHIYWDAYAITDESVTKILLAGLTKSISELVPLAKSWWSPAKLLVLGQGSEGQAYDPTQRAYVVLCEQRQKQSAVELTLQASEESPVFNPALIIKNWGEEGARLSIDGQGAPRSENVRYGHVQRLEGTDLVIWMRKESRIPIKITVTPENR
jgi:hypothetical protein